MPGIPFLTNPSLIKGLVNNNNADEEDPNGQTPNAPQASPQGMGNFPTMGMVGRNVTYGPKAVRPPGLFGTMNQDQPQDQPTEEDLLTSKLKSQPLFKGSIWQ